MAASRQNEPDEKLPYSRYEKSFRQTRKNCISLAFFSLIPFQTNGFNWHLACRLGRRMMG